jgi:hypothetical protein
MPAPTNSGYRAVTSGMCRGATGRTFKTGAGGRKPRWRSVGLRLGMVGGCGGGRGSAVWTLEICSSFDEDVAPFHYLKA